MVQAFEGLGVRVFGKGFAVLGFQSFSGWSFRA